MDPLLECLIRRIPQTGAHWSVGARARWLRAFAASVDLIQDPDSDEFDLTLRAAFRLAQKSEPVSLDQPLSALAIACMGAERPTQAILDAEAAFWCAFDDGDLPTMKKMAALMGADYFARKQAAEDEATRPAR